MSSDDKHLNIHIGTTTDTSGAKQAAGAMSQVEQETKRVEEAIARLRVQQAQKDAEEKARKIIAFQDGNFTQTASAIENNKTQLSGLTQSLGQGASAGRVLGEVMRGNIGAVTHLGTAFKALSLAIRANPIGMFISLGAMAATALAPLILGLGRTKDAHQDSARAALDHKRKLEDLNAEAKKTQDLDLENYRDALNEIKNSITDSTRQLELMLQLSEKIDDAQLAADLEANRRNTGITEEQRAQNEIDLRQSATNKRRGREDFATNQKIAIKRDDLSQQQTLLTQRQNDQAAAQTKADQANAALKAAQDAEADLKKLEAEKNFAENYAKLDFKKPGGGIDTEAKHAAEKARDKAKAAYDNAKTLADPKNKKLAEDKKTNADTLLSQVNGAVDELQKRTASLENEISRLEYEQHQTTSTNTQTRTLEDTVTSSKNTDALREARLKDQERKAAQTLSQRSANAQANTAGNKSQAEALAPILKEIESAASDGNITIEELNNIIGTIKTVFEKFKDRDAAIAAAVANLGRQVLQMQSQMKANSTRNNG